MIARLRRFLGNRGMRRLRQNRLAMAALALAMVYVLTGAAVPAFDLITIDQTTERVGPDSTPGFGRQQSPEKRLFDAERVLDLFDRALGSRDVGQALAELRWGERRPATRSQDELRATVERGWDLHTALAESANLNQDPSLWPQLTELEQMVDSLWAPLAGLDRVVYGFRRLLGTDRQGRSIAVRAVYSIKVALQIGAVTAAFSVLFGSLVGAAAAFFGGWVDHLVIWLYSTFSSIPNLVLLTVLVYMFSGSAVDGTLIPVYAAFCMTFWIGPCRVIRGETLRLKELEYVQAATALGFSRLYVLVRHVLPNTAHLMFINFSLLFIGAIKSEVILSFLNLGVKEGASWGIMINQSAQEVANGFFWQIGAATFFMVFLVLAFNILSDALQDAFDPKHVG